MNVFCLHVTLTNGELAEWSIAAVLKTVEPQGSRGSNPLLSAIFLGFMTNFKIIALHTLNSTNNCFGECVEFLLGSVLPRCEGVLSRSLQIQADHDANPSSSDYMPSNYLNSANLKEIRGYSLQVVSVEELRAFHDAFMIRLHFISGEVHAIGIKIQRELPDMCLYLDPFEKTGPRLVALSELSNTLSKPGNFLSLQLIAWSHMD